MSFRRAALSLAALLTACSGDSDPNAADPQANVAAPTAQPPTAVSNAAASTEQAGPALALDGQGLRLLDPGSNKDRLLAFGASQSAVIAPLLGRGTPAQERLSECGAGPLEQARWEDGLSLYFQDGKFAGWALDGRNGSRLTTAAGIGIGSTRAELQGAYAARVFESSLGTEFEAGNLFGLLDGAGANAKITNLGAGVSCNMR